MSIVYQHTRNDNGNVFYVGVGYSKKRAYTKSKRNIYWQRVVDKYGYSVNITHENICREEACKIEQYLISFWREALGKENITNLTDGGDGMSGHKPSLETRELLRQKKLGHIVTDETRKKIREKKIGFKVSEETKEKIRKAGYKRKHTEEVKLKISLGNKGKKYSQEAKDKISKANKGKVRTEEFKKYLSEKSKGSNNKNAKKFININTGIIYGCARDAMKAEGISFSYFRNQIKGKRKLITPLRYL